MKMLASLVSDDGNTPLVKGFTDGMEPLSKQESDRLKKDAEKVDMKVAAQKSAWRASSPTIRSRC
jgi:hypothetical protein